MTEALAEGIAGDLAPPSVLTETPVCELLRRTRLDGEGSLTQQVYRLLHRLIVSLHLMPNQFLPEKDVAAGLDLSKTPVREAFIRLSEEGLVRILPKIGTYVSPIDIKRALRGYFIRESLESACAEALAKNAGPAARDMLRRELEQQRRCVETGDADGFYVLDNQFHGVMFTAAGLLHAKRLVDSAKAEVDRIKGLKSIYRFCRPDDILYQEHAGICEAIFSGDPKQARAGIRSHLTGMNEAIQAILKEERLWKMFNSINQGQTAPL